jgi:hypothetical protein
MKSWCGESYYCYGTLYCSSWVGAVHTLVIGSLGN